MASASGRFDKVIVNGKVFVDSQQRLIQTGVAISGGKIARIDADLTAKDAEECIDAKGLLVLPGGVDSHCHIEQKTSTGLTPCDNFHSASVSALCGGTTTLVPFACQHRGARIKDVVEEYRRAAKKAAADYAFHVIVADPTEPNASADLAELFQAGITSVKVYMTYDALKLSDGDLLEVLALCRRHGAMVMVHAESHDMIKWITTRLLDAHLVLPKHHATARHPIAEREATHRAISFAEFVGTPLLVVHVSSAEAVAEIARARERGVPIFAETCPQYLTLTKKALEGTDCDEFEGAKYLCSPPLRDEASQNALWASLAAGDVQVVSSDHSAYRFSDDGSGKACKQSFGKAAPFTKVPMGLPGLETRLPLLFNGGVTQGRLGECDEHAHPELRMEQRVRRFVMVCSTNPARLYGLYPQKGAICLGADADLVLWDCNADATIGHASGFLHDDLDYTPYEGFKVAGLPVCTISRGEIVFRRGKKQPNGFHCDDSLVCPEGRGQWCACGRPDLLGWTPSEGDEWPSNQDPVIQRANK